MVSTKRTKILQFLRRCSLVVAINETIRGSAPAHERSGGQSKMRMWTLGMSAQYLRSVFQRNKYLGKELQKHGEGRHAYESMSAS